MTQDNGGPAFPCSNEQYTHGNPQTGDAWSGLSLRDWFAGQIASGMAAYSGSMGHPFGPGDIAQRSYQIADALLSARKGPPA